MKMGDEVVDTMVDESEVDMVAEEEDEKEVVVRVVESTMRRQYAQDKQRSQKPTCHARVRHPAAIASSTLPLGRKVRWTSAWERMCGFCAAGSGAVRGRSVQSDQRVLDLMPIEDGLRWMATVAVGREEFRYAGACGAQRARLRQRKSRARTIGG